MTWAYKAACDSYEDEDGRHICSRNVPFLPRAECRRRVSAAQDANNKDTLAVFAVSYFLRIGDRLTV